MSDVTTIQVVPDTTYVIREEDSTSILVDGDTYIAVNLDETLVIAESHNLTQVNLGEDTTTVWTTDDTRIVSTGTAGPQGPPGPPGPSGGTDTLVTAAVAIGAGRVVTLESDGAHYYDPTTTAGYGKAVGVSKHAAAANGDLAIALIGPVTLVGAGFTPGTRFWAAANGMLTSTPPTNGLVVPVGYAVDADTLFVQFESYLEW